MFFIYNRKREDKPPFDQPKKKNYENTKKDVTFSQIYK